MAKAPPPPRPLRHLALFAAGVASGALIAALLMRRSPSETPIKAPPIKVPPPSKETPMKETPPREPPAMLPFGHHGPVTDFLTRDAYALAYNRATRNAHWSAEHLVPQWRRPPLPPPGSTHSDDGDGDDGLPPDRSHSSFAEDDDLPAIFKSRLADYAGSGFDRGHLVPAADAMLSQHALDQTFLLSNISPQVGRNFNRGYWAYLERFVRSLTDHFDDVHVLTGPLFLPMLDADGKHWVKYQLIGEPPNTAVPTHFFKIIVAQDGNSSLPAVEAFVLPNEPIPSDTPLTEFIVPIDSIARASGLNLFPKLDMDKTTSLCRQVDCVVLATRRAASRTTAPLKTKHTREEL